MNEWIARLTHPSRFRPGLVLAAAVGVTALFFAVIAVNVELARHRLHEATYSAARLGRLVEEVFDLHEQLTGVLFKAVLLGGHSAEADYRRISGNIDDILQSFDSTPGREPVPGASSVILRAYDPLKASELQACRWVDAGYPDSALAALLDPQHTRADRDFHGAVHQTARQLTVFRAELANRFTRHLLIIALVTAVFVLMLTAAWIVIVLIMRRFYEAQARSETALRESELRYRTLFEYAGDYALVLERDEHGMPIVVDANRSALEVLGYARDELVGRPISLIDPDISPELMAKRQRSLDSDTRVTFQVRRRPKDGSEFLAESAGTMLKVGARELLLAVERDITQRVRTQEALRESEERFRQVAESAGEWIWEVDAQGLFTYSNAVVEKILGYTRQEIVGKMHFYDVFAPEGRDEFKAAALEAFARKEPIRELVNTNVHKNGSLVILETTGVPVLDTSGNFLGYRGTDTDITERKRAEEALRESENRYRVLVQNLPQKIFLKDRNSVYVSCNQNYAQDLKIKPWEIVGKTDCDFYPGELAEKYRADDQRIMESGKAEEIEEKYLQHGREVFVHTVKTPIRDDQGHVSGILGIFWDVTERKRAEEALQESETKYRALIDALPHGVVIMQDGLLRFSNPAADAMFGGSGPDGLAGLPWETIVAERDRERVRGIMEARARGEAGVPTQYPVLMRRGDQEEFPAEVYVRPFQFGGRFAVQEVILDVTERRRAEEALRESEERFHNLADQAPVLIWMAGVKRHTYYFNRTWQTFTGRSIAQEYGQGWQQGVHPEDLPGVLAAYESAFASRSPFTIEYRLRHTDGLYHSVLDTGVPRFASEQRFTGYIGSCVDISGRLDAEQALRGSEERFRTLYHKTPAMLQSIDAKGRLVGVSDFWLEAMGYERNEVIGLPVSDFLFPQSPPGGGDSSPSFLLNNGDIKNVWQQFVTKSGRVMDTIVSAVTERDAQGSVLGSLAVIMDITDLKRAEDALRTQAQILDEIRDAVVATDLEARITSWNKGAERLYGYGADEVMGRHLSFLYADPAALENDVVAPLLEHGTHASEVRLKRKSGEEFDGQLYLSCSYDGQGRRQGMIGYSLDITERKRTEQVQSVLAHLSEAAATAESLEAFLSLLREQLSTLLDTTNFYVALYDEEKGSYTATVFADKFDGFSLARRPGLRSMTDYVRRTGTPILADQSVLEELRRAGEIELVGAPARQWMGVPLRTSRGVIGVMVVQSYGDYSVYGPHDLEIMTLISGNLAAVIERKRAMDALIASEEQLRQSQKMEAIGRMAGGIAHDFNNLLTSILGHSEITLRGLRADHPLRDGVEEVAKAAERAAGLTRQLLAFSRKQVLQPRVLDLNAIVADMEKMLRRLIGEDIELLTRLQPDLGTTKADPGQIEQVLMNLVVNARDAMPAGGRLIIETANVEPDEIHHWQHRGVAPGRYIVLAVSDSGTGMDAETKSHIYEPFFTTKEQGKGTGLGLSTVYGIVKQSGGHIWVYSELGRGSVFRIYLPRVAEAAEELNPPEPNAPQHGQETILLVEDEDSVRDLARRILMGKGYRVRAARLPAEALQLAELHHGPIDLLIADVIMPQLGGEELAQKVIALHPETKVLFISGYPHYSLGCFGVIEPGKTFLEKPFSPEALASHVRQLLDTPVTAS